MPEIKLCEIYIYPVKSLGGIKLHQCEVTNKGLKYDRKWMVIDQNNHFLTQRRCPLMTLIYPSITDEKLVLSAPDMENIGLPLHPLDGNPIQTSIWNESCLAYSASKDADEWLSQFLAQDCRLVYQADETTRQVDQNYADPNHIVTFSDGFPFLIISESSLASLNQEMKLTLPMIRFRPNLVIAGSESYAEDYWRQIMIGNIIFKLPKPCSRCAIPTLDTETAQFNKEPLKTLSRLRKWKKEVYFGQNALHDRTGKLTIGDPVEIIQSGPAQPPKNQ